MNNTDLSIVYIVKTQYVEKSFVDDEVDVKNY